MRDGPKRSVAPGGSSALRNRSRRAIFLCYHSIAPEGPRYLTISADLFERQLAELRRRGIQTGDRGTLEDVANGAASRPTAFLTFDDGFRDNHHTALPILREYGCRAFVFVLPPLVDDGGALEWPEVREHRERFPELMRSVTWPMLEEMREGGFEIGSHTLAHHHLPSLDGAALRDELLDSRRRIAAKLGFCDVLAYPFGEWSVEVEAAARDCGYRFAFSLPSAGQRRATALSIPRVNVDYRDDGRRFAAKLSPAGRALVLSPAFGAARAWGRSR